MSLKVKVLSKVTATLSHLKKYPEMGWEIEAEDLIEMMLEDETVEVATVSFNDETVEVIFEADSGACALCHDDKKATCGMLHVTAESAFLKTIVDWLEVDEERIHDLFADK